MYSVHYAEVFRLWRIYPHPSLAAARSRSRENSYQLFSNTFASLRYLTSELVDLRVGYAKQIQELRS